MYLEYGYLRFTKNHRLYSSILSNQQFRIFSRQTNRGVPEVSNKIRLHTLFTLHFGTRNNEYLLKLERDVFPHGNQSTAQSFLHKHTISTTSNQTHRISNSDSRKSYTIEEPTNVHVPDKPTAKCRMTVGKISLRLSSPQPKSDDVNTTKQPTDKPRAAARSSSKSRGGGVFVVFACTPSLYYLTAFYLRNTNIQTHTHTHWLSYTIDRSSNRDAHTMHDCLYVLSA